MFCPNCGEKLNGNEDFCAYCGANLKNFNKGLNTSNVNVQFTTTEMITDKSKNFIGPKIKKVKEIIVKYKKKIFIAFFFLIFLIICLVFYGILIGFEKLSWNDTYLDPNTKYVAQTKLKLGVNLSNDKKIDEIKFSTNCGETKKEGLEVTWDLSNSIGNCEIVATYKLQKIKKSFKIISSDINEKKLGFDYEIDENSLDDLDYDGLTNKEEKEYGTNPEVSDTDLDGLDDYYEIFVSKTDPLKMDTDGDGLNDYDEIQLGLDPLKADSRGDGIKDGNRELTYNYEKDNIKLVIKGKGNIASLSSKINENTKISNKNGLINKLYSFYTDGQINEIDLTISYTDEEIKKYNLNEETLSIYYYNEKSSKYEKIDSFVNKENKTISANLNHFSNYVVGDNSILEENFDNQILFVLDNSWSMYSKEQYFKITGKQMTEELFGNNPVGFDSAGLRFKLTKDLITKLSNKNNNKFGLSEFRRDYANLKKIGSDIGVIKSSLENMNGKFVTSQEGTNISNALLNSINEFASEKNNKYIIILTDGEDSSLSVNTNKIIKKAKDKDVKICSIGFGNGSNNDALANVSNSTGCKFYSSGNVDGLIELFDIVKTELDDDLVDINNDNVDDGILVADSGFIVNRDGFSFRNYGSNLSYGGHCYGMATVAELYYKKVLPLKHESITLKKDSSYSYDLTNTYFANYANLYDYKLKTNVLKYEFGFKYFNENFPADFRDLKDNVLIIKDNYKNEIKNSGLYDFSVEKSPIDENTQKKEYGFTFKSVENYYLNELKMQTSNNIEYDDLQIFNAIYASFIKQNVTNHYSSASNFTLWMRNLLGVESIEYKGAYGFINILKNRLKDNDAPVISSKFDGVLHGVNAISLVQDINNPNHYYIGVYDNVYPGEKRYVEIVCNQENCVTKANDFYNGSDQPIRISPSLEYDLKYYTEN